MSYPQQGGYGPPPPPPGYGYPPPGPGGYGHYPPPRKDNTGLILGITGAIVVVVVAVVLVIALTGDGDGAPSANGGLGTSEGADVPGPNAGGPKSGESGGGGSSEGGVSSAEDLADLVVEVIETQDEDLIDEHACNSHDADQLKSELSRLAGMDASASVEDVRESGDTAQALIEITVQGESENITVEMEKDGDAWCASGI